VIYMAGNGKKSCILIIDDNSVQLVTLGRILSQQYEVRMANGGAEGLQRACDDNVDLILLDLFMEDMSGFDVILQLKQSEATASIPVIFVTGSDSAQDEKRGLSLGAADYIRKPFNEVMVLFRVEQQLRLAAQMRIIEKHGLVDELYGA